MKNIIHFFVSLLLLTTTAHAISQYDSDREAVEKRIRPVGQVNVAGESQQSAQPVAQPEQPPAETKPENEGEAIYNQYCVTCHSMGVAGAPKTGDKAWQARLKKAGSIDQLVTTSEKGIRAMPKKGTCNSCTREQLKAAIEFMLPKS